MQPPQLGMDLPGRLLSYKKSTGPRAGGIGTGDVQILDAFTGFLLLLKINNYPSAGTLTLLPECGPTTATFPPSATTIYTSPNARSSTIFLLSQLPSRFALFSV